jgi:hypothetical protein
MPVSVPFSSRTAGFAYVRAFAENAKTEGLVVQAAARVELRGVATE